MKPSTLALPLAAVALGSGLTARVAYDNARSEILRPVSAFAPIADRRRRSVALFEEAGVVIRDPRCVNCHPRGNRPNQGDDGHPHQPAVARGQHDDGIAGLHCQACHQAANQPLTGATIRSVPGNPKWRLAPRVMAWEGRTLGQICSQIRDPARNGGKSLDQIAEHMAHDPLVGWAWEPGPGRRPVAGSQQRFGELIRAWIATGAACPLPLGRDAHLARRGVR